MAFNERDYTWYVHLHTYDYGLLKELVINDFAYGSGNVITDETYLGKAAKKFANNDSWAANYITNGWQTLDLSQYYGNGTLEFDAVGAAGGETFSMGLRGRRHGKLVNGEFHTDNDQHPHQTSEELEALFYSIERYL